MKTKIYRDILSNLVITIATGAMLFSINSYFVRYLGIEKLGLMKLFNEFLAYLNLAEIGMVSASTYVLYKPLLEKDEEKLGILLSTISSLYKKIFIFIIGIGILVTPAIPYFITNTVNKKEVYIYWILYVIGSSLNYLFAKYAILLTADQKFILLRYIQGGSKFLFQCLQLLVIIQFQSFLLFIILLIGDNLLQAMILHSIYRKHYSFIKKRKERDNSIIKNLKNLFWHKLAGLVVFNTDLILISKYTSLEIVAMYASYLMINSMILTCFSVLRAVLAPKIGKLIAVNNSGVVYDYWRHLNVFFLFMSIVLVLCTYQMLDSFLVLWLGKNFLFSRITKILILINLGIQCFRGITEIFKDGSGFFDDIELPILEAIINFVSSILLGFYMGLNGVILGTILSNVSIILVAKPVLVFQRCFKKTLQDYCKIYSQYLILLFLSIVLNITILNLFSWKQITNWSEWILQGGFTFIIVCSITFILFLMLSKDFRGSLKSVYEK